MPPAAPQPLEPNAWRCPACQYEMTGVPGPICPECGIDAVAEHERRRNLRAGDISPDWLLFPAAFVVLIALLAAIGSDRYEPGACALFFLGGWLISLRWTWYMRRAVFVHGQAWRVAVHVVMTIAAASLAVTLFPSNSYCNSTSSFAILTLGWMVTALLWRLTRGRELWTLLMMSGLMILIPGALMTVASSIAIAGGLQWSPFSDPRTDQIHDQYPLRWNEIALIAPAIALFGASIVLAGISVRRSALARHTSSP